MLASARSVLELPGERAAPLAAYVMAGRATIAHCDLLVAIWDGELPRGRGGTGEVVQIALLEGTPILHLPIDPAQPPRLLWSGLDPHVCTTRENCHAAAVAIQRAALDDVLGAILRPPGDPASATLFALIMASASGGSISGSNIRCCWRLPGSAALAAPASARRRCNDALASEWQAFRAACESGHGVTTAIDPLQRAYCWSDQLARRFAQTYRSGHIFNFLVGAVAVLTALAGLVFPQGKLWLATRRAGDDRGGDRQHAGRGEARMAPAMARLSPARRAAAPDAQPQAARRRRAAPRPPRPLQRAPLDRMVCRGHVARDGLPERADPRSFAACRRC
jgi:hypothetical protein